MLNRVARAAQLGAVGLALWPLIVGWRDVRELFWFGDEWDQLDQIDRAGFWPWVGGFFGENFAPVFKVVWGGLALASGHYFVMVIAVWLAHATCVVLLGNWLRHAAFPLPAILLVLVGFGAPACNFETLIWTVQLLTVLMVAFFLAAARWQASRMADVEPQPRILVGFVTLVLLSTFSSVRGPLAGIALGASAVILPAASRRSRFALVAAAVGPAIVGVAITGIFTAGNHRGLTPDDLMRAVEFAGWHFALNPLHRLFDVATFGPRTTSLLGVAKLAVLIVGWRSANAAQRRVLLPLLVLDLGNAVLLGLGRYHTGLAAITSSRYQYLPLLCFLPFAGLALTKALRPLSAWPLAARGVTALLLLGFAAMIMSPWPRILGWVAESNGTRARELLSSASATRAPMPGTDLTAERARQLVARHHLR